MPMRNLQSSMAGSLAVVALAAAAATASAADISISDARVAGGKLVVTGTTSRPNTRVRLDSQAGAPFNVTSDAGREFTFSLVYLPSDCIVTLQILTPPSTLGAPAEGVVADCGPRGVSPHGAWSATAAYLANDLVTYLGSSWRAKRNSTNKPPVAGADWELFAAGSASAAQASGERSGVSPMVAPDGPAGGDLTGTYPNPTIKSGAVTTAKIAPLAIGNGRLMDDAVTTGKIADGTIANADLATGSVDGSTVLDGSITGADVLIGSLTGVDIANSSLTGADIADSSLTGADIASGSVTSSDILNHTIGQSDINGTDHSGAISLSAIANGRCVTVTGSVGGAKPGDAAILTTNGAIPSGMVVYAQRAVTNGVEIKACNLSGATSTAISELPVRVLTFH